MAAPRPSSVIIVVGILALLAGFSMFTVKQTDLALKLRFGRIIKADYEPGLHLRVPFVDTVRKFDRRILTQSHPSELFLTAEGKILNVDFFVKWRIRDVSAYYRSTGGSEKTAEDLVGNNVKNSIKSVIARLTIQQLVSAERAAVTEDLLVTASRDVKHLGIDLVDVRVRRIDLPDDVTDSVFRRMDQTFAALAARLRAEGSAQAEATRAQADRERTEILAEAAREAQRIRGEGDAQATDIYARTYSRDPEFYRFYRSLQAYRNSLGRENDIIVISPDGEFFRYLDRPAPAR